MNRLVPVLLTSVVLGWSAGCDDLLGDQNAERSAGEQPPSPAKAEADPEADGEPTADPRAAVAQCIAACDEDDSLSATDRETCKLNCRRGQDGEDVVDQVTGCMRQCRDKAESKTDRATCRLRCTAAVTELDEGKQQCARECFKPMLDCFADCRIERSRTDRATCQLGCQNVARTCIEDC